MYLKKHDKLQHGSAHSDRELNKSIFLLRYLLASKLSSILDRPPNTENFFMKKKKKNL